MIVNYGKQQLAFLFGGSITNSVEDFIIGTGSSTVSGTDTELVTPSDRQTFTKTVYPSAQKVRFQGDWNSVEMSGTQLSEFGLIGSASGLTGSIWSRNVIPSLTFDGTNELRIESTNEIY